MKFIEFVNTYAPERLMINPDTVSAVFQGRKVDGSNTTDILLSNGLVYNVLGTLDNTLARLNPVYSVRITRFKESGKYYDEVIFELQPEQTVEWYDTMMALIKEHCTSPSYHYVIQPQGDFGYQIMRPIR